MNKNHQAGIALFQVLLITAIISVLAIQFSLTARNQISIANDFQNRIQAQLQAKTVESQLLFTLFTENYINNKESENQFVRTWNFYGEPFYLAPNIEVKIQDQNSLVGLLHNSQVLALERAFQIMGLSNPKVIAANMIDWQDEDNLRHANGAERADYNESPTSIGVTNLPFQSITDLKYVKGVTDDDFQKLKRFVTILPQSYANPMLAPKTLLALNLPKSDINNIIERRKNNQLTSAEFSALTGIHAGEFTLFSPSGLLQVTITAEVNAVKYSQTLYLNINPYSNTPLIEYVRKH